MNSSPLATEYCAYWSEPCAPKRLPVPVDDHESRMKSGVSSTLAPLETSAAGPNGSATVAFDQAISDAADGLFLLAQGGQQTPGSDNPTGQGPLHAESAEASDPMQMSVDSLLQTTQQTIDALVQDDRSTSTLPPNSSASTALPKGKQPIVRITVEDLDEKRTEIRKTLVERILDVLNVHTEVTFELATLIGAAAAKDNDETSDREETGITLIEALISFTGEEDFRPLGKQIASYAHLLGICLQDEKFFNASVDCLKENLSDLVGFVKILPDQNTDQSHAWIGPVLLVIERILSEDAQPSQITWDASKPEKADIATSRKEALVSMDDNLKILDCLLEIMPRVGRDEALVLATARVLTILTRHRSIALKLAEKRNIQRLFLMIKQLSGMTDSKLPNTFILLLRHVIEDETTVKRIMKSEIISSFETRSARPIDTVTYMRQMSHLILRSPGLFVEVTNEVAEIIRYEKNAKAQILGLKQEVSIANVEQTEDQTNPAPSGSSTQIAAQLEPEAPMPKTKTTEVKAPVVEHPSGVVHYLLSELLAYKDVEDKETLSPAPANRNGTSTESPSGSEAPASSDNSDLTVTPTTQDQKKSDKPEFRLDQHPIHLYRCFLLQCLTDLLQSYNQAKIEFINFSRKSDARATTPSKPRSGVLSYLLNDIIPVGTLSHDDGIAYKKRNAASNWAISTIVALCLKTNENGYDGKHGSIPEDEQTDLLFVRKFVLEHVLKAYKDASSSNEHPDVKYARLLDIADLFQRLLVGRLVVASSGPVPHHAEESQPSIAKLMYEKNFIAALTNSIADIDLNFPGSKRAIKYILRPLKHLTSTAVHLSETSSISSALEQKDEDEISTASSVSEGANDREETPDLFRNSTLGMLEPARDEESPSNSSDDGDEDMYDDDDDDEDIDFDDELNRDGDEVISDEDEDLGDAGPMEGLHGDAGMDVEVVIDEDDDDDDDDDDDPEDSDDMDEDEDHEDDMEALEEITGDDENASLADADEDWAHDMIDDVNEADFEAQEAQDQADSAVREIIEEFGGGNGTLHLGALGGGPADLQMDIESGRYMEDVVRNDEDDDDQGEEEEDRDDDLDEEEEIYQPDLDADDALIPETPWGFDQDDESFSTGRQHHHHHHRHAARRHAEPWNVFPGGHSSSRSSMPLFRSHNRPQAGMRSMDDGAHPLLQRTDHESSGGRSAASHAAANLSDFWVHGMELGNGPRGAGMDGPVSLINNIIATLGSANPAVMHGPNGAMHLQINTPIRGSNRHIPAELRALFGSRPSVPSHQTRGGRDEHAPLALLYPEATFQRWQQEARLIYNGAMHDKAMRVLGALLSVLEPPAIERRKQQDEAAAKAIREQHAKELQEKLQEEQRKEQEKAEQERRAAEEREAVQETAGEADAPSDTQIADAPSNAEQASQQGGEIGDAGGSAMEGVEMTDGPAAEPAADTEPATATGAAGSSQQPQERVTTRLGDREIDITGLGIDLEYLEALPEEMRQEVLMSQIAIHRSEAAAAGEPPSEISQDFLQALPREIREELLQHEAAERRRQERQEARRQQQASGAAANPAPQAEDMDPASFLASLDPTLRQHVLADQDEDVLAHLPPEIAAEARALGMDRTMPRYAMPGRRPGGISRILDARADASASAQTMHKPRKQVVQMLDRAGVATILRLIFTSQQGSARDSFNSILQSITQNRQTRAEVVTLLLSILQDASFDVNAAERSFAHLSLRAKQSVTAKTPQPLTRTLTGSLGSSASSVDVAPFTVVQQCLGTLVSLTASNPHIPSFFLTEHEFSFGSKDKSSRKGKGKDTKASKYPLNALLSLLDRRILVESSAFLEQLAVLLNFVTKPLKVLLKPQVPSIEQATTGAEPPITENDSVHATADATDASVNAPAPLVANAPAESQAPSTTEAATVIVSANRKTDDTPKKMKTFVPPVVPEENLRLVVSIIAARECSKKAFEETIEIIRNLKAMPGAREILSKGLLGQAQVLGETILTDLDELLPQIQNAESGTDIQGLALPKFATASSHQLKLLRVLMALDHLFRTKENKPEASATDTDEDILTSLYENSTFGPLWDKLSECLGAIRQGEGMLNVASILQPLIEALMVVCQNTARKNASTKASKEQSVTSPAPDSGIESLFFRFTGDHRKILNELVRHNPKLMAGNFMLLVKNPKILEFDNKRNYFTRQLHTRVSADGRSGQAPLHLPVRRDQVFRDSYQKLYYKSGAEIKFGKLSIRFVGEEGVDAGGVTREWFQVLSRQMFNPDYALFEHVASDRTTFHPNKHSAINEEHLMFFKFVGRIIGKAIYENRALDCHFSRAVYKRMLGKVVSIKDMETLDLEYYKSLIWMLENDITDIITETFSMETDDFGATEIVDLTENGRNIPVTEENKSDYVQRVVEHRLTGSVQAQLAKFLEGKLFKDKTVLHFANCFSGFYDIVPAELISIFNEQELELLISGLPDIDVDDWRNHTEYHNYTVSSPQIQWFWRAVRSFDKEERAKLLQFVTGTSKVPLNGFGQLEGMNGYSRFNIHRDYGNKDRLPSSHTCFNRKSTSSLDPNSVDPTLTISQQNLTSQNTKPTNRSVNISTPPSRRVASISASRKSNKSAASSVFFPSCFSPSSDTTFLALSFTACMAMAFGRGRSNNTSLHE